MFLAESGIVLSCQWYNRFYWRAMHLCLNWAGFLQIPISGCQFERWVELVSLCGRGYRVWPVRTASALCATFRHNYTAGATVCTHGYLLGHCWITLSMHYKWIIMYQKKIRLLIFEKKKDYIIDRYSFAARVSKKYR